jgi:nicotinate-nucleotide adenylyltransferase
MKKIAFYGGSFDPVHKGHLAIAEKLTELFGFDEFYFVPAFHAPHKAEKGVTSAFCRYAMLALATQDKPLLKISTIELDAPEKPFTIETLTKLKNYYKTSAEIFFVMGADSWADIRTWREWEKLLLLTNFIVVTRPHFDISLRHVTPEIAARVVDCRGRSSFANDAPQKTTKARIFFTDAVRLDISASEIRRQISLQTNAAWRKIVPEAVAEFIEKYHLYQ